MFRSLVTGVLGLVLLTGCDNGQSSGAGAQTTEPGTLRGCTVDNTPPVAPGGYYTNGTTVCTADGTPHLFHGVARPSLEWGYGENITPEDFNAMAEWHANVVRVALNQDFWLSGAAQYYPQYHDIVDHVVQYAEAAGLDVIFDLHWSDRGDLSVPMSGGKQGVPGTANQQQMADVNSKQFWSELASKYKDDGHVIFELYNEPHDISWGVWLGGGTVGGYKVVGMQELYDTVRAAGAENLVIAGGLSWAFDLSGVGGSPIKGYNIIYATHPYKPQDPQSRWQGAFGYLATQDIAPVIATEFGDTSDNCTGQWDQDLFKFADERKISWTAWAWFPSGCKFPALISDWSPHTPTVQGDAVKAALLAYPYEPGGNPDAGKGGAGGDSGGQGGANAAGASCVAGASSDAGAGGATQ
jgi:aryl-phospho-beta-D-glucosidase BglC (GH1 family)